jgi:hypothetical protein
MLPMRVIGGLPDRLLRAQLADQALADLALPAGHRREGAVGHHEPGPAIGRQVPQTLARAVLVVRNRAEKRPSLCGREASGVHRWLSSMPDCNFKTLYEMAHGSSDTMSVSTPTEEQAED